MGCLPRHILQWQEDDSSLPGREREGRREGEGEGEREGGREREGEGESVCVCIAKVYNTKVITHARAQQNVE